ncbi:hypothetical protein BDB01DRAFT_284886 [Pilobolus umbonatus]|nr:hypothetical protein BDB01DRAFT_284886 [Pilobolus umbonatus]
MTSPTPVDVSQTSNEEILQANEFTYLKNNLRLRKLQQDMMEMTTYGSACDELYQWILDKRAYTTHNEKALIACLKAICDKGLDYGPWSAIRVLSKAAEMCGTLTVAGQGKKKRLSKQR